MQQDISARIRTTPSLVQLASRNDLCAPASGTCKRILNFLRPDFDRVEMASASTWDAERRIKSLTEEQYDVLDAVSENAVCLVKGPAGTGKTNIAIEAARRLSLSGKRVLLACFNRHLGAWLRRSLDEQGLTTVVSGHVHGLLRDRIARSTLAGDLPATGELESEALYGRLYFDLGALAIEELDERFDAIIIDETQDFEAPRLSDVVQAWTQGVSNPKTILFGDFTRQALYGMTGREHPEVRAAFSGAAVFNLSVNCRNTRRIATQTDLMCGFTGTKVSEKQAEGDPVEVFFAATQADVLARLAQIITALRGAGFRPADVVILGTRRREHSILGDTNTVGGWRIKDMFHANPDELSYSTIHSFKGLERPVVIVVDAGSGNSDETDSLLYVAMTRARLRLFVVCPEEARSTIAQRMMDGILAMAGDS
jgi:superfamily I DNA/RNA helicase